MARHTSAGTYVGTWVALVALAAATLGLSRLSLGGWQLPVALGIAAAKGALVVTVFMHLLEHRAVNRLVFGVAVLLIVLLVGLTAADVLARP